MPADSLGVLQAATTSTSTTESAWYNELTQPGTQREGMTARINIQAHSAGTTPGSTVTFSLQSSTDGTNSIGTLGTGQQVITPGVTPANTLGGVGYLEIDIPYIQPSAGQFLRVVATFSDTTSEPSISWSSDIVYGWPG